MSALDAYLKILPRNPGGGGLTVESAVVWDTLLTSQARRSIRGHMAEFGVFKGFGAALSCGYLAADETAWLVDIVDCSHDARANIAEVCGHDVLARLQFVTIDSMELRQNREPGVGRGCRFIHVDGEHSYDAVINDLTIAEQWLLPQGVIAVDDFFNLSCAGVTQAVFDFCRTSNGLVTPFLIGYNKAYLCRSRYLGFYRKACLTLPDVLEARGRRCQLTAGGFAFERPYFGLAPRATNARFQVVGRYLDDVATFTSAMNDFW